MTARKSKKGHRMNAKRLFSAAVLLMSYFLISCSGGQDYGSLVVKNKSGCTYQAVTAVYVKKAEDTGFALVYSGEIKSGGQCFISLEPEEYSVRIMVTTSALNGIIESDAFYETGYNDFRLLKENDPLYVAFDGRGLYFE